MHTQIQASQIQASQIQASQIHASLSIANTCITRQLWGFPHHHRARKGVVPHMDALDTYIAPPPLEAWGALLHKDDPNSNIPGIPCGSEDLGGQWRQHCPFPCCATDIGSVSDSNTLQMDVDTQHNSGTDSDYNPDPNDFCQLRGGHVSDARSRCRPARPHLLCMGGSVGARAMGA
jgi:hypothetical protein